jgi:hypothetical protein
MNRIFWAFIFYYGKERSYCFGGLLLRTNIIAKETITPQATVAPCDAYPFNTNW